MALGFVISEVLFEPKGDAQWIELYNGTGATIDLDLFSIGWGRNDYLHGTPVDLTGDLLPGETFLIGGAYYGPLNGFDPAGPNPYDMVHDFKKDLRKGNKADADGIALFQMDAADITPLSVPYFTVIYGKVGSTTKLLDETGSIGTPMVTSDAFLDGESIEIFPDGAWKVATTPGPDAVPNPEPGTGLLLAAGLVALAISRQRRSRARS